MPKLKQYDVCICHHDNGISKTFILILDNANYHWAFAQNGTSIIEIGISHHYNELLDHWEIICRI